MVKFKSTLADCIEKCPKTVVLGIHGSPKMRAFLEKEAEQRNERAATNRSGEGYAACDAERRKDLRGDLRAMRVLIA